MKQKGGLDSEPYQPHGRQENAQYLYEIAQDSQCACGLTRSVRQAGPDMEGIIDA